MSPVYRGLPHPFGPGLPKWDRAPWTRSAGPLPLAPIVRQLPETEDPSVHPSGTRARTRTTPAWLRLAAVVALGLLAAACGSASASSSSRGATGSSVSGARTSGPAVAGNGYGSGRSGLALARATTAAYRSEIGNDAAAFVSAVGRLHSDLASAATGAAQTDELAAQADYDGLRMLESGNTVIASTLDERRTDVAPGQAFTGLHAVEQYLWPGPTGTPSLAQAQSAVGDLVAQAPVAQYLLSRDALGPEAIGTTAVNELAWVNDTAVPGQEEQFSHLDAVDVSATVAAAHAAFAAIQPLARLVAPGLTADVASHFGSLATQVDALGPIGARADDTFAAGVLRPLAQQVDATGAMLARLSARLAPYGTAGATS